MGEEVSQMADTARITITGNIGNVREVRTVGDKNVLNFSVAVNDGNPKDPTAAHTSWYNVAQWGTKEALDALAARLTKGLNLTVNGNFSTKPFQTTDGKAGLNLNVFAKRIDLPRTEAEADEDNYESLNAIPA